MSSSSDGTISPTLSSTSLATSSSNTDADSPTSSITDTPTSSDPPIEEPTSSPTPSSAEPEPEPEPSSSTTEELPPPSSSSGSSSEPTPEPSTSEEPPPPPSSSDESSSDSEPSSSSRSPEPEPSTTSSSSSSTREPTNDPTPTSTRNGGNDEPTRDPTTDATSTPRPTTVYETTIVTTNDNGSPMTTVYQTESTVIGTVDPSQGASTDTSDNGGGSSTGAIVGGVVGGVFGLALLGVLTWFLLRRAKQRRLEKEFDGNFDPQRFSRPISGAPFPPATLPDMGQVAEEEDDGMGGRLNATTIGGGVVSPYALYQPSTNAPSSPPRRSMSSASPPPMSQYSHNPPMSVSQHSHNDATTTSSGYTPFNPYQNTPPMPLPSTALVGYAGGPGSASSRSMSGKEREAHQNRYNVANPDAGISASERQSYLRSGPSGSCSDTQHEVLVHQDSGPIDQAPSTGPDEIPPTYDSLRRN